MTLHDYHTLCPMYTLLDPDGQPCGACTARPGSRSPEACMKHVGRPPSYLLEYQARMRRFLGGAAQLFVPNVSVRDIIGARYPDLAPAISVVEHGHVRPDRAEDLAATREHPWFDGTTPLNVAVIGSLDVHKGSGVFRDLLRANRREETIFHLYGTTIDPDILRAPWNQIRRLDGSTFVYHGPYEATDIMGALVDDRIHVGLQLSIWPETFSYTLSEFVGAGIPVIGGRLGAQGERIERCRLGWTVADIRNPASTLAILDDILRRPVMLQEAASAMRRDEALAPISGMWARYLDSYRALTRGRKPSAGTEKPGPAARRRYVACLAARAADIPAVDAPPGQPLPQLQRELDGLRERLHSPRHRIADALGNAIQKMPVVWPLVRSVTEALLRREQRRAGNGK
jgi:hypothetical protein